jgi:hypothetical protein
MQLCRIIYYSLAALHVSSDIFAQHQEHLNCITASGITHYVAGGWYYGSVGISVPDGRSDHDQQHCYHHVPTINQRLLLQLIGS